MFHRRMAFPGHRETRLAADTVNGGFGYSPKFPHTSAVELLMALGHRGRMEWVFAIKSVFSPRKMPSRKNATTVTPRVASELLDFIATRRAIELTKSSGRQSSRATDRAAFKFIE